MTLVEVHELGGVVLRAAAFGVIAASTHRQHQQTGQRHTADEPGQPTNPHIHNGTTALGLGGQ